MKPIGILCFPGTQCDQDTEEVLKNCGIPAKYIWHKDSFFPQDYCAFILPGGFSYGDYLRSGALAAHSPALLDLHKAANTGFPILGICNGFQILCEADLLNGTLMLNASRRFIDQWVQLKLCNPCASWGDEEKEVVALPIAHAEGCFYASSQQLKVLEDEGLIWWQYVTKQKNGSMNNIAGIMNKKKNVAGLMPHPERAAADWMGGADGLLFFKNFL